ncbi:MAG TPA: hypothetical protein DCE42_13650 [Myxococcales bacterium]|nr:hypothetical protein [Deltaproteobacteria bacterium]MBU54291.1 hypothetical protein [Deltaproteobacteria bacterium]HAA55801.1 hypothetical protein [Myxococcales bacterium]|tara:strand:- start:4298 stop:5329 length:1032 start_codon:yes stop_codon:yes gene_type:complete
MSHKRLRNKRRPPADTVQEQSWPAFTDLLGAFVLVIFLTMLFFLINFRQAESTVQTYGRQLKVREAQLKKVQQEIQKKRQKLREERAANRRLLEDLKQTEQRLRKTAGAKKTLELMFEKLKKERAEIEAARRRAEEALAKARQSQQKAESERQQCQRQIESYVGVRRRIIKRIFDSLRQESSDPSQVQFDTKGGAIVLGANILFGLGKWHLQPAGKKNIKRVWTKVHQVIKHPLNRPYIAGIIIEGYTSSEGSERINWRLSTRRAYAALRFLEQHGADYWSKRGLIAAAGYGHTRPIRNKDGSENKTASRRIEIRLLFRDREKLEQIMKQFTKSSPVQNKKEK